LYLAVWFSLMKTTIARNKNITYSLMKNKTKMTKWWKLKWNWKWKIFLKLELKLKLNKKWKSKMTPVTAGLCREVLVVHLLSIHCHCQHSKPPLLQRRLPRRRLSWQRQHSIVSCQQLRRQWATTTVNIQCQRQVWYVVVVVVVVAVAVVVVHDYYSHYAVPTTGVKCSSSSLEYLFTVLLVSR